MSRLKEVLAKQVPTMRDDIKSFVKQNAGKAIGELNIGHAFGGMRGLKAMVCDTSEVPPDKGLIIRGIPIKDLTDKLPEEVYWLLLTGKLPGKDDLADMQADLKARAKKLPSYVFDVLNAMPEDSHPMAMLNSGILCLERESEFRKRYSEGMTKADYWEPTLDDSLNIIAWMPEIAAYVYRKRFNKGGRIAADPNLDLGGNYAHMLGIEDPTGEFKNLMRLYLVLHSDHEGGNVSAHTCHCVGSALSDAFYAVSAGLNGLAGPLHGLANQECLAWILETTEKFGGAPTEDQLAQYAKDTLNSGKVIPGYGHAVLRITDPRFDAFLAFGKRVCPDDPVFKTVSRVFDVVPGILKQIQKIKDPWPNVDAGSGSLLHHFGLREFSYYTVLFSVSRAMGMTSQLVMSRAWGEAIERPKSMPTSWFKKQAAL
jgi:citrate synthase